MNNFLQCFRLLPSQNFESFVLAYPLYLVFNIILQISLMLPIFEKQLMSFQSTNRRHKKDTVFLNTSVFAKLFETIILAIPKWLLSQYGFTEKRSATTNLEYFTQYVAESIDNSSQVDDTYIDFHKVFTSNQL